MSDVPLELKPEIAGETLDLLRLFAGLSESDVAWTVGCLSGKAKGIRGLVANLHGTLIAPVQADCVYFATSKSWRGRLFKIPLDEAKIEVESKFLSESVSLTTASSRAEFHFLRGQNDMAELVALSLKKLLVKTPLPTAILQNHEPKEEITPLVTEPVIELRMESTKLHDHDELSQMEKVAPFPVVE